MTDFPPFLYTILYIYDFYHSTHKHLKFTDKKSLLIEKKRNLK